MKEIFHQRLKRLRNENKLTVKEMSARIGVPESSYREWEYGRAITGGEHYIQIAKVLGLSVYELLTGNRPPGRGMVLEEAKAIRELLDSLIAKLDSFF